MLKQESIRVFLKYLLVGIINTIVGYGIIFSLMFIGTSPEISNIIGYAIGIIVSYALNKIYTFKSKAHPKKEFPKFVLSLLTSYGLNFLTLILCIHIFKINPYISQIISGAVYTLSGFVFLKYFAFRNQLEGQTNED
ncbi:GtrA family protein [Desulfurella amilsii]|uniref:GtrA family protein n=1 Tax=Desulfurella amilsii TaxID=1562698 RepID=UPI002688ED52